MKNKMRMIRGAIILLAVAGAGCASLQNHIADNVSQQGVVRVTGIVTYRMRVILPADALVRMDLVDISRQGAPALTIGLQEIEAMGRQVPIPFEILYRPADIDPAHIYAVNARILQGGSVLFANTNIHKVITNGVVSNIEVVVEQRPRE